MSKDAYAKMIIYASLVAENAVFSLGTLFALQ